VQKPWEHRTANKIEQDRRNSAPRHDFMSANTWVRPNRSGVASAGSLGRLREIRAGRHT
jgi:hypothetical protein